MKRMMIIAVMIGAMLMPAQVSAQSSREKRGDKRVQVDSKRGGGKNDVNFGKSDKGKGNKDFGRNDKGYNGKNDKRGSFVGKGNNQFNKHSHKPKVVHHKPKVVHHKPKVIVNHCHHNHGPKVIHHHHSCNGDVVGAAAAVIGTVALISLLAD